MSRVSKTSILAACMAKQDELIENFARRIEEVQGQIEERSNEPAGFSEDDSSTPDDLLTVLQEEAAFVQAELNILRGIDPENGADVVERGAVVITDQRNFFIAVSSEEIEVDGVKFFGMSDKAPLYARMRGLKKGDEFEFNNLKYKILDIY